MVRSEGYEVEHRTRRAPGTVTGRTDGTVTGRTGSFGESGNGATGTGDPDARWLALLMHAAFFLLLGASLARFLLRHPGEARTPWIIALSVALAVLYVLGPVLGSRPTPRSVVWLGVLVAVWMVLVVLAPSFAWCAVPLFYTGLRILPPRAALALVALLTVFVVAAQRGWPTVSTRTWCSPRPRWRRSRRRSSSIRSVRPCVSANCPSGRAN